MIKKNSRRDHSTILLGKMKQRALLNATQLGGKVYYLLKALWKVDCLFIDNFLL